MKIIGFTIIAFLWANVFLHLGCSKKEHDDQLSSSKEIPSSSKQGNDLVVARIGKKAITWKRVEEELQNQNSFVQMRFSSLDRRKEWIKNYVRFEVLVAEARRQRLDSDPEVIERTKRALADQLLKQLEKDLVRLEDVTDKEVETYYWKNRETFRLAEKDQYQSFDSVRNQIKNTIFTARRRKALNTLVEKLHGNAKIQIDQQMLANLPVGGHGTETEKGKQVASPPTKMPTHITPKENHQ